MTIFNSVFAPVLDVAVGPMYATLIGIPLLIVAVVVVIAVVTVKLIKKSRAGKDDTKNTK